MRVTLDASVTLKWFLRTPAEADLPQATALLRAIEADEIRLVQPPHALAEVAAVLVRERPATVLDDLADVARIFDGGTCAGSLGVYRRAMQLSRQLGQHLFDTLYHTVAFEEDATLITADARYYNKASVLGNIMLLGDFSRE
ncbi:MAG: type II toxin-antitoxin system VapC family toxin [Gammaproteobacteria bacterium]